MAKESHVVVRSPLAPYQPTLPGRRGGDAEIPRRSMGDGREIDGRIDGRWIRDGSEIWVADGAETEMGDGTEMDARSMGDRWEIDGRSIGDPWEVGDRWEIDERSEMAAIRTSLFQSHMNYKPFSNITHPPSASCYMYCHTGLC